MGVDIHGNKKILGFIESASEAKLVIIDLLKDLESRGLNSLDKILYIIDGSKGLSSGIRKHIGKFAQIQRCMWHKRENVLSYLGKKEQDHMRKKLQHAYERPSYDEAREELNKIATELKNTNTNAYESLQEGLEETLTLHSLGEFGRIGKSFKTTNCLESFNKQLEVYTSRVCKWKNSDQRSDLSGAIKEILCS